MRTLTIAQRALLRAPAVKINVLSTWYLDEGTFRFCDDVVDLTDGTNTWIGASALTSAADIRSGNGLSAEPVTLIIDGLRMAQHGIDDPAAVLRQLLDYFHAQRRVDLALGFSYPEQSYIQMVMPTAALKINYCRLADIGSNDDPGDKAPSSSKLEVMLDSLAARYNRATFRTRTHEDQHEIDPDDDFFSFVQDITNKERTIYWGKASPYGGDGFRPPYNTFAGAMHRIIHNN